jgi:hypothetical protein
MGGGSAIQTEAVCIGHGRLSRLFLNKAIPSVGPEIRAGVVGRTCILKFAKQKRRSH